MFKGLKGGWLGLRALLAAQGSDAAAGAAADEGLSNATAVASDRAATAANNLGLGHAPELPKFPSGAAADHPAPGVAGGPHEPAPVSGHAGSAGEPSTLPGGGHTPPAADHTPMGPAEHTPNHPEPPAGEIPPQHGPVPDTFDPAAGHGYTSGDPHHPGLWPPHTPESTWSRGDADPGWHYVNRGDDKGWMSYQEQISGAERLPDGRIPEYTRLDPDTGNPVDFDGHTYRDGHEVFLDAKDGYEKLATDPGKPWTDGMTNSLVNEIPRQLRALPEGATLEIHVSNPLGAAAIRELVEDRGWYDVTVIYTPKSP